MGGRTWEESFHDAGEDGVGHCQCLRKEVRDPSPLPFGKLWWCSSAPLQGSLCSSAGLLQAEMLRSDGEKGGGLISEPLTGKEKAQLRTPLLKHSVESGIFPQAAQ